MYNLRMVKKDGRAYFLLCQRRPVCRHRAAVTRGTDPPKFSRQKLTYSLGRCEARKDPARYRWADLPIAVDQIKHKKGDMSMEIKLNCHFADSQAGTADGTLALSGAPEDCAAVSFYWSKDNTPLTDYLPIATVPRKNPRVFYCLEGKRMIPEQADSVCAVLYGAGAGQNELCRVSCALPQEKIVKNESPEFTFFCISDLHIGDYWNNKANREAAFSDIAAQSPDVVVVGGDIGNACQRPLYERAVQDTELYFKGIPVLYVPGNHDYYEACPPDRSILPDYAALEWFFEQQFHRLNTQFGCHLSGVERYTYDVFFGNVHFILLNVCDIKDHSEFTQAQCDFLERCLTESDARGAVSVVVAHMPIQGKVGAKTEIYHKSILGNDALESVLNKHCRVFYASGHTHCSLDMDDVHVKVGGGHAPTYMNTACVVWLKNGYDYDENGVDAYIKDGTMGLRVDVFDGGARAVVRGRHFGQQKWIPRCLHQIDLSL